MSKCTTCASRTLSPAGCTDFRSEPTCWGFSRDASHRGEPAPRLADNCTSCHLAPVADCNRNGTAHERIFDREDGGCYEVAAVWTLSRGSLIQNVVPLPTMLSIAMVPPCSSMRPFTTVRPR